MVKEYSLLNNLMGLHYNLFLFYNKILIFENLNFSKYKKYINKILFQTFSSAYLNKFFTW